MTTFPTVDAALLDGDDARARDFLAAFATWRDRALDWLADDATDAGLSDDLRLMLAWTLGDAVPPATGLGPYQVGVIPTPRGSAADQALDRLVWRSSIVDFLADVWDVAGPPRFDVAECGTAIEALFMPAASTPDTCIDCLRPLPADPAGARHYFVCPIRLRRDARQ